MHTNSTTIRLADTDWTRFTTEAESLAREIAAVTPGITAREAGDCAAQQVEARYAAELARSAEFNSDAMIANAHHLDGSPRYTLPRPTSSAIFSTPWSSPLTLPAAQRITAAG